MNTNEYKIDKTRFVRGQWDNEPDRAEWKTAAGLPALIIRNRMGALCGYVAVLPGHPAHGKGYSEIDGDIDVHGGLTYAEGCSGNICHVPAPGEPDDVWWLGFDCGHAFDYTPALDTQKLGPGDYRRDETYRDIAYVKAECESLARQLTVTP